MEHPINPPTKLVQQWKRTAPHPSNETEYYHYITLCAAQWGADQELEACIDFVGRGPWCSEKLRDARRPKPPSLKEQALKALREAEASGHLYVNGRSDTIRRALEQLND